MNKKNIKLNLSFDGRNYAGWQKQKNVPVVQGKIERVIKNIFQEAAILHGTGRTDSGTHAICYTANFQTKNHSVPTHKIPFIFNQSLPADIRIISAEEVPVEFHARFSAKAREYVYLVMDNKDWLPFYDAYAHRMDCSLSMDKLREACRVFVGHHDFRHFCQRYEFDMNFVRDIYYFRAKKIQFAKRSAIIFTIKGNGFLWGMIRTIIAVCINYAQGLAELEDIRKALELKGNLSPKLKVKVPSVGLYFKRAYY